MVPLNHFRINGHTVVGNSGGKTSGYNLWLHLQANGGGLTPHGMAVFTNTGWEHDQTLDFLAEQELRWSAPIAWLEFCRTPATYTDLNRLETKWQKAIDRQARLNAEPASYFTQKKRAAVLFATSPDEAKREACRKAEVYSMTCFWSWRKAQLIGTDDYRLVTHASASRKGEPFEELLEGLRRFRTEIKGGNGVLPNGVQRICTGHLKVKTTAKFATSLWGIRKQDFEVRLGLRADEEARVLNAKEWSNEGGKPSFPLYEAGIVKADVAKFWADQPFGMTLKAYEGNCGGCYMKRRNALVHLIREGFFDVEWWKGWEAKTNQRFRQERTYSGLQMAARSEQSLLPDDYDNAISCESGYCSN